MAEEEEEREGRGGGRRGRSKEREEEEEAEGEEKMLEADDVGWGDGRKEGQKEENRQHTGH